LTPAGSHPGLRKEGRQPVARLEDGEAGIARDGGGGGGTPEVPAPPSLSLPKGGGAIRGIGESFTINPATGGAAAAIPVAVSPGRGIQPSLSLRYDSGCGNGPFGLGWRCDLPAIARRTDRGVPRYRDAEDSDTFLLDGEDLVPARIERDGAWIDDTRDDGAFAIRRYAPRIEGAFARIERWTEHATGAVHWRVTGRDNLSQRFGITDGARVCDPDDPRRVFAWLLEETWDERGNAIVVEYKAEDRAGVVTSAPPEDARSRPGSGCTWRYPKRVRYGNARPGDAADWAFELVFDYG
jgi:hypothetical protein